MTSPAQPTARYLLRTELEGVTGAFVTIDVIRAFTTAAYAFAAGAREIYLVGSIEAALEFKAAHPGSLAMGEDRGERPAGFDLSNSPVQASRHDLSGRTLVQRTSAGTQGVLAARHATRQWCASLVCAAATARALLASGLGPPTYVITGRMLDSEGRMTHDGTEDEVVARYIESLRIGAPIDAAQVARDVLESSAARRTLTLGAEHVDPEDIAYAARVDAFDFAMEVTQTTSGLRLTTATV
ncbi:MAG TPA: 2-phosphosulfolactate phosphatase [Polyangiales bacterium]|nr:2-phosphosulfolactate phosphatase [Polyangiales bacterium]